MLTRDIMDATRRLMKYQQNNKKFAQDFPPQNPRISDKKDSDITSDHVQKMLQTAKIRLSPREAQAVLLRFQENCCPLETAYKMGVKPQTVNRYVSVGLDKIRKTLEVQEKG